MSNRPYFDTFVGLYSAAVEQAAAGHRAMHRVECEAVKCGYSLANLRNAVAIPPVRSVSVPAEQRPNNLDAKTQTC